MNWSIIEGKWNQLKGDVKSRWAKLTDDDLTSVSAKREKLVGKIQERYGVLRDEAERQVDSWLAGLGKDNDANKSDSGRNKSY
jgi:uncharacterized protein YjbJ (UPF0337 family)